MGQNKIQELVKYQQKVADLQKELGKVQRKLLALPGKFGYKSVSELIGALQAAEQGGAPVALGRAGKVGRRQRAKITPEIKAKVKAMAAEGKTGAEIAKNVGISLPSVQNIKKELGLVKKRS